MTKEEKAINTIFQIAILKTKRRKSRSEISHRLTEGGLRIDESYALQELLKEYQRGLDEEKLDLYERLLADERFKGRRAMLKELSHVLKDFSPSQ